MLVTKNQHNIVQEYVFLPWPFPQVWSQDLSPNSTPISWLTLATYPTGLLWEHNRMRHVIRLARLAHSELMALTQSAHKPLPPHFLPVQVDLSSPTSRLCFLSPPCWEIWLRESQLVFLKWPTFVPVSHACCTNVHLSFWKGIFHQEINHSSDA